MLREQERREKGKGKLPPRRDAILEGTVLEKLVVLALCPMVPSFTSCNAHGDPVREPLEMFCVALGRPSWPVRTPRPPAALLSRTISITSLLSPSSTGPRRRSPKIREANAAN